MIYARWDIENSVFNKLKKYSALNHCFVHNMNAIEAIIYIMIIATNLMELFIKKRLKKFKLSQKELIRLLDKELNSYCIDTT